MLQRRSIRHKFWKFMQLVLIELIMDNILWLEIEGPINNFEKESDRFD